MAENAEDSFGERPQSIKDALRILDDALAAGGAAVNEFVGDVSTGAADSLRSLGEGLQDLGSQTLRAISDFPEGREALHAIDARVRMNPWPVIGGVALGAIVLGVAIGRSGRQHASRDDASPRETFYSSRRRC